MYLQLLDTVTSANGAPTAVKTVASITTVAGANLVDGERVILADRKNGIKIFEFDKDGLASDPTRNPFLIPVTGLTADQVRDALITAINGAGLDVVATSGGAATVTITANQPGANTIKINETVADGGFAVSISAAGSLSGVATARDREQLDTIEIWSTGAASPANLTFQLWEYTHRSGTWLPLAGGPDANLVGANNIAYAAALQAIVGNADRLYLQVSGTFASASVFAHLVGKLQRRGAP